MSGRPWPDDIVCLILPFSAATWPLGGRRPKVRLPGFQGSPSLGTVWAWRFFGIPLGIAAALALTRIGGSAPRPDNTPDA